MMILKEMMLTVPKSAVALTEDRDFDFKWIDNINKSTTDILDFISFGDCAPNNRFNYRYKGSKVSSKDVGLEDMDDVFSDIKQALKA